MRVLDQFGCFDGLCLPNLAGLEVLLRQCQLAEYVNAQGIGSEKEAKGKKGNGGGKGSRAGSLDESSVFSGDPPGFREEDYLYRLVGLRREGD